MRFFFRDRTDLDYEPDQERINDIKVMCNFDFEVNPEYTSEILNLCSYQPMRNPLGIGVLIRENVVPCICHVNCGFTENPQKVNPIPLQIEIKEVVARTRSMKTGTKEELMDEVEAELIYRMKCAGKIGKEKKPFTHVLVPTSCDNEEGLVTIKTKHLENEKIYLHQGENYFNQGFVYMPYKFVDLKKYECSFRYALIDSAHGTDAYFKTEEIEGSKQEQKNFPNELGYNS